MFIAGRSKLFSFIVEPVIICTLEKAKSVNLFSDFTINKLSDCLNFQIFFFKSGAVPNRTYRAWGAKIGKY